MSNILQRTIWGALFVAIVVGSFIYGNGVPKFVLATFMCIGIKEFFRLFSKSKNIYPLKTFGIAGGLFLYSGLVFSSLDLLDVNLLLLFIPLVFIPFLYIIFSKSKNPLLDLAVTFFSWIYIVIPFFFMFKIYTYEAIGQPQWIYIIGFFTLIWANDTFAYLAGRSFGKNKLFERISPKKTWEGATGGFVFSVLLGLFYAFATNGTPLFWAIAATVISPIGILGDLLESKLKRLYKVKDSGFIMPGHGGVLDRFDAAIYASPFFYLLLLLFF